GAASLLASSACRNHFWEAVEMTRNLAKRGRLRLPRMWIALAIAPICIGAAASSAVAGHATAPAGNGPIAFQRYLFQDQPLQADIFIANAHGSGERRITRAPRGRIDDQPEWSADGKRLWFERQNIKAKPMNGHATFVVNLDGTGLHRVTPWNLRAGDHPDWSPDGALILVRSNANGPDFKHQGNLFVVRSDGTGLRRLTSFDAHVQLLQNGSFSPDGKSVVFAT